MIKAAIIGCGRIASLFEDDGFRQHPCTHAGAYDFLSKNSVLINNIPVKIVAASDIDKNSLERFSKRWNAPNVYGDYKKMLKKEDIDVLSVCTHPDTHKEAVINAAKAVKKGKNIRSIFCEKPIANSLADAKKMVDICRKNNIRLTINHTRRWYPACVKAKQLIEGREIGDIVSIRGNYNSGLMLMGTHMADLFRYFIVNTGISDVESVIGTEEKTENSGKDADGIKLAYSENFDAEDAPVSGMIFFRNGIAGHIDASCRRKYLIFEVIIDGTEGRIMINGNGADLQLYKTKKTANWLELDRKGLKDIWPEEERSKNAFVEAVKEAAGLSIGGSDPRKSSSSGEDGLECLKILLALKKSAKTGKRVFL